MKIHIIVKKNHNLVEDEIMRNNKRWIAVVALAGVTAVALVTSVVIKNNLNKGPANAIEITQEGTDLGIKQIETLTDGDGNITGYKVNVDAKGFGEVPMELAVTFDATADTVTSVEVISQSETEGLGSNVTKPEFLDQFKGVKLPVYIEGMDVSTNDTIETFSLAAFEATTVATTELVDGTYEVVGSEPHNGWTSQVKLTVEGGKITDVVWDAVDADGNFKSVLSQSGEYKMTEDGATWADQAKALAEYVVTNQGVAGLTLNEEGKTDAVATVSISINEFVAQVEEAMNMAAGVSNEVKLNDGTYEVVALEPHNGWTSQVTLTIEGGKITNVVWDAVDADGNFKSVLSQNGEYKMTEDGATWADQAKALADYVIANQGIAGLNLNEEGKTDAVASVSISINEFVAQVEEAMNKAAGETETTNEPTQALIDGVYEIVADEPNNGWTSQVTVTVEGGKITNVVWDAIDAEGNAKSVLSQSGEYTMTEDGATWADQAKALADYVIENQGVSGLTMNEEGKTDVVATVSISINEFVSQVESALKLASGQEITPEESEDETAQETIGSSDGTQVDAISGATVTTKAVLNAINNAQEYLINNVLK